jgi:hypothetical protein
LSAAPYDYVRTLYRVLLAYAAVAIAILVVGLVEFVHYEPYGQTTGSAAHIVGVYRYNLNTQTTSGSDQSVFARNQTFAVVVDWSSLPKNITVDARWYDSFGDVVGRVGPGTPADLGGRSTIPVPVPNGFQFMLPGDYIFVVERLQNGDPVEVLARRIVLVERT